jgi:hypothetical protein
LCVRVFAQQCLHQLNLLVSSEALFRGPIRKSLPLAGCSPSTGFAARSLESALCPSL